jgi:dihydrofolate reductase
VKATVYIATSVDGFIARPDGGIDWLSGGGGGEGGNEDLTGDYGYSDFFDTVDALIMGRNTFELVLTFGEWPYGDKPVVVLASSQITIPRGIPPTVEWMSATPGEVVARLAARGMKHVYVDGGVTIQRFLAAGLIQRLILTRIPILIGSGIPLFGPVPGDIPLKHIQTRSYPSGLVQTEYEVVTATSRGMGK